MKPAQNTPAENRPARSALPRHCLALAWLITPPHSQPGKRRVLARRIGGVSVMFYRVPVRRVQVVGTLPEIRLARVFHPAFGETWAGFERLASTRERFLSRFREVAGFDPDAPEPSGATRVPAMKTPARPEPAAQP